VATLDSPMTRVPMLPSRQRLEHPDQVVTLPVDRLDLAGQVGEGLLDRLVLLVQRHREQVQRLDRGHDLVLVGVELGHERLQLREYVADGALVARGGLG